MRRYGPIFCLALFAFISGMSVAAADPAITVAATRRDASGAVVSLLPITDTQGKPLPPSLLLGEYVIASGQGFPANQPVLAYLVVDNQAYPLAYQDLTTSVTATQLTPLTDATGAFQSLAFALPVPSQVTGTSGEIMVSAGPTTARAPVSIDTGVTAKAGRGDKLAVSIGAGFAVVAIILILLMLRGLPMYPTGTTAARRVRDADTT